MNRCVVSHCMKSQIISVITYSYWLFIMTSFIIFLVYKCPHYLHTMDYERDKVRSVILQFCIRIIISSRAVQLAYNTISYSDWEQASSTKRLSSYHPMANLCRT